jgi:hypothetical protein
VPIVVVVVVGFLCLSSVSVRHPGSLHYYRVPRERL